MKSCKVLLFLHCKFCILYFLPYIPSDISFLSVILRNFTFSLALFKIFLISSKGNPSSNRPPFAALALRIRLVVRLFALAINGSWLLRWRGRGQSFSGGETGISLALSDTFHMLQLTQQIAFLICKINAENLSVRADQRR